MSRNREPRPDRTKLFDEPVDFARPVWCQSEAAGGEDDKGLDHPLARRTNYGFRRLRRATGSVDGAADGLVSDRARSIRSGARAAGRRANAPEYVRRCDPTSTFAERNTPGQPRAAGRRAIASSVGVINRPKDGRSNQTHIGPMARTAQVAARPKKGACFARLPVDTGVLGAMPLSMLLGGGDHMARRRLLT